MSTPESRWLGATPATLSWDSDGAPRSCEFEDFYYSTVDGLAESRYVFLAGNSLPQRWQDQPAVFCICETGFGTGLNFLATWHAWRDAAGPQQQLHYIAIEKFPLLGADMIQAHLPWPELQPLAAQLQDAYPPPLPGRHCLLLDKGRVRLDLVIGDVSEALAELAELPALAINSWYLDGFAPAHNPDMWKASLYPSMARLSAPGAQFATFTAASEVRRGLQDAGFQVQKLPGFGLKREMLRGEFNGATPVPSQLTATPWHLAPKPVGTQGHALVIGAGLAGSTTAAALQRRGWTVTVVETNEVAAAASGNEQGVLYTRLSHKPSALNHFSLHSFCFANRYYSQLLASGGLASPDDGELCGALHLLEEWESGTALAATVASLPGLVEYLSPAMAAQRSGLQQCSGGLFFPMAGWMNPPAVCQALLSAPGIKLEKGLQVASLCHESGRWIALDKSGRDIAQADVVVVSTGAASNQLPQLQWLPLQIIRGQVSHLPSTGELTRLRTAICHSGYLAPARHGRHCIGASFDLNDADTDPRPQDHIANLDKLGQALPALKPQLSSLQIDLGDGRVGFRTASPDYLPMVGPVPDYENFCADYAAMRKNARRVIPGQASYLPGLYLSTAHGSRGLTSTPLCAELLAAEISGESWPMETAMVRALSPARFIVRDLVRNRL
jgi:tRNA 5-methylaminomethyl-2-thiouridine biosynthesis bifunctional protein